MNQSASWVPTLALAIGMAGRGLSHRTLKGGPYNTS